MIEYFKILMRWKKIFFGVFLISTILSISISLMLPKWYKASVEILPPQTSTSTGLSSIISQIPMGAFGKDVLNEKTNLYMSILKSRKIAKDIVDKFNLIEKYKANNLQDAINEFKDNVYFVISEEGAIKVFVLDKDQDLVAKIANYNIQRLDELNREFSTQLAKNNRMFIEGRIRLSKQVLSDSEDKLKRFQERNIIIDIETQTIESIRMFAELKSQIIATEIKINVLEKSVSKNNPELISLKNVLIELNRNIKKLQFNTSGNSSSNFFHPYSEIPELAQNYLRLISDVEIQKKVLEYLIPEYENAKINEARNTPTIQILDEAVRPERKARPRRALIVICSVFASLFLTWVVVILKEDTRQN